MLRIAIVLMITFPIGLYSAIPETCDFKVADKFQNKYFQKAQCRPYQRLMLRELMRYYKDQELIDILHELKNEHLIDDTLIQEKYGIIAVIFERRGNIKKAMEYAELSASAGSSSYYSSIAHYSMACYNVRQENPSKAIENLKRSFELASFQVRDAISDACFKPLNNIPEYRQLISAFAGKVAKKPNLPDDKHLLTLNLSWGKGTPDALANLYQFTQIQKLNLAANKIGDTNIDAILVLPNLVDLDVADTGISGQSMNTIAQLKTLQILNLARNNIDDASIKNLINLKRLRLLALSRTAITDASIPHLAKMKNLDYLFVSETQITPEGLAKLRKALPNCEVTKDN